MEPRHSLYNTSRAAVLGAAVAALTYRGHPELAIILAIVAIDILLWRAAP
jgi:hypothetical protein